MEKKWDYIDKALLIKASFVLIAIFVFAMHLNAQKRLLRFQHYTSEQGLSQNMIDCLLKDHQGFLWFGTWNGLNRFDGYSFKIFKHDPNIEGSVSNNFIYALCQDKFTNIWVGTESGLNVYMYKKNRFRQVTFDSLLISGKILSLAIDNFGFLWIGTANAGLYKAKIINENGSIKVVNHFISGATSSGLFSNEIHVIYEDRNFNLWIGTGQGLNLFQAKKNRFIGFQNNPSDPGSLTHNSIYSIYLDNVGSLWVGTMYGLNRISMKTFTIERFYLNETNNRSLPHNTVRAIIEDNNSNLLIGTLGGLAIYNRQSNDFIRYRYALHDQFGLNNDFVNCLICDKQGNVWIGTDKGGINKYNINQKPFEYFENESQNSNSLSHNTINSIYEDNSNIWIGTAGGGLNKYIKSEKKFVHYNNIPQNSNSISSNFITSIHRDELGNLWVATWGGGLNKLAKFVETSGYFRSFLPDIANTKSITGAFVSSIVPDKYGYLWIGTMEGLNRLNPKTEEFDHFQVTSGGMAVARIGNLIFDTKGNLWVCTEIGLYKIQADIDGQINQAKSEVVRFVNIPGDSSSIGGNYVISSCLDKKGNLWFGTYGNGLSKLIVNKKTGKDQFVNYTESDGFSNNVIFGILEDNKSCLWLSTDNGLNKFDPTLMTVKKYYVADGLQSNQFYWSAYYKNLNGKMYFGGMNGLNAFYPDSIIDDNNLPLPKITDFKIYNQSAEVGTEYNGRVALPYSVTYVNKIKLSYKSNEFSFEFSALHYNLPEKNEYEYKLEGFDPDWIKVTSKRRYSSYTNLKGGNYTFWVRASNNDGMWSETPAKIAITIMPPVWATWWFRITLGVILIFTIIFYNRYRLYSLEQRRRKLEIIVHERTAKVEEQNEKLAEQTENLRDTNLQLEKRQKQIEGQKEQLELQNVEILQQRDQLLELNKKVQHANQQRLNFFTNISHEFRTPLTLIVAPLEQIISEVKDRKLNERLQLVYRNSQRLLHLINQLMDYRKVETGKLELKTSKADIIKFASDIYESFTNLAIQRNINYSFLPDSDSFETWFDTDKIENIIYNLLSNAFKYTPVYGSISLRINIMPGTKLHFEGTPVLDKNFSFHTDNLNFIEIVVSDSGIGIPPNQVQNIFKRFYRVPGTKSNEVQGSGIGLSLTRELIKAYKGLLFVKSEPDKGSVFRVVLPVKTKAEDGEGMLAKTITTKTDLASQVVNLSQMLENHEKIENTLIPDKIDSVKSTAIILIVEDNYDLRTFLVNSLSINYSILHAADGERGFRLAKEKMPNLIISDIMMPVMNGLELCKNLKEELTTSHIPIILLTARSEDDNWIEGFDAGADDYISKPFNINILKSRIENILKNRARLRGIFKNETDFNPSEIVTNSADEQFLRKALKIVEENYADSNFGVEDFIDKMSVSRSLLHKKLTAIVDQSAGDFITTIRLKKSVALLKSKDINISEIAYQVGFNDPKYFSRIFRKYYGVPPSEYIDSSQKKAINHMVN